MSCCHGSKFSGVSNLSHERWPFLFLSAIMHRKVIHVNSFIFFCYVCMTMLCWTPEIWLPWQCDVTTSPLYFTGAKLSLNGPKGVLFWCLALQLSTFALLMRGWWRRERGTMIERQAESLTSSRRWVCVTKGRVLLQKISIIQVQAQEILDRPNDLEYDSETGQPAVRTRQVRN